MSSARSDGRGGQRIRWCRHGHPDGGSIGVVIGAVVLAGVIGAGHSVSGEQTSTPDLATRVAEAERQLDLASSDTFSLVMEPFIRLTLMYGGAVLQEYPVAGGDVGRPRILFLEVGREDVSGDWCSRVWRNGTLVPSSALVDSPGESGRPLVDGAGAPAIPPTVEEAIPVPRRYWIRFDGGLAIEVEGVGEPDVNRKASDASRWEQLQDHWQDLWTGLRSDRDDVRVRVRIARATAEALYRSLPPQVSLIVLGSAARPDPPAQPAPAAPTASARR